MRTLYRGGLIEIDSSWRYNVVDKGTFKGTVFTHTAKNSFQAILKYVMEN